MTRREDAAIPGIFPAYAGVNLADVHHRRAGVNLPRVCGGEPKLLVGLRKTIESSPRMRG